MPLILKKSVANDATDFNSSFLVFVEGLGTGGNDHNEVLPQSASSVYTCSHHLPGVLSIFLPSS